MDTLEAPDQEMGLNDHGTAQAYTASEDTAERTPPDMDLEAIGVDTVELLDIGMGYADNRAAAWVTVVHPCTEMERHSERTASLAGMMPKDHTHC